MDSAKTGDQLRDFRLINSATLLINSILRLLINSENREAKTPGREGTKNQNQATD